MMRRGLVNLTGILVVLWTSSSAFSQNLTRSRDSAMARSRSYRQNTGYRGAADRRRDRLGTFQTNRYQGARTRTEQLTEIIESFRQPNRRHDSDRLATHPMRDLLDQRNLLSPRSAMAAKSVSYLGRNLVTDTPGGEATGLAGAVDESQTQSSTESAVRNIERLFETTANKEDKYHDLGVQAFRNRDYKRAASYFDVDQDIHFDWPRPFLAGLLTAYQNQDFNQAYTFLRQGLKRAKSAEDLKLDRNAFFEDPRDFARAVNDITIWAKTQSNVPAPNAILAYYAWLNGDQATAIDAIDAALKSATVPEEAETIQKFRELLTAQPAPQP
jgi:hypothetical protein